MFDTQIAYCIFTAAHSNTTRECVKFFQQHSNTNIPICILFALRYLLLQVHKIHIMHGIYWTIKQQQQQQKHSKWMDTTKCTRFARCALLRCVTQDDIVACSIWDWPNKTSQQKKKSTIANSNLDGSIMSKVALATYWINEQNFHSWNRRNE